MIVPIKSLVALCLITFCRFRNANATIAYDPQITATFLLNKIQTKYNITKINFVLGYSTPHSGANILIESRLYNRFKLKLNNIYFFSGVCVNMFYNFFAKVDVDRLQAAHNNGTNLNTSEVIFQFVFRRIQH
jgi:hypothetical protein